MSNLKNKLLHDLTASIKIAADNAQPPSEGHPTDHIEGHLEVPEGETVTTAADEQVAVLGNLAAGGTPATNDKEKVPPTMQTTVLDGTSTPAELQPDGGPVDDPGADPSHPASPTKNEKYASMRDPAAILTEINRAADIARGHLQAKVAEAKQASTPAAAAQAPAATAAPAAATPEQVAQLDTYQQQQAKTAAAICSLIPADRQEQACKMAAQTLQPYVQYGIELADKLANFMQDPEVAAAMGGGGDPMAGGMGGDPMAGAAPGGMGGGDPMAAAGADPMAAAGGAGGGGGLEALVQMAQQVAAENQTDVATLFAQLAAALGGDMGGGGGGDMGGGGAPPPAEGGAPPSAAPADSAPKSSSSESEPEDDDEGESDDEGDKSARKRAAAGKRAAKSRIRGLRDEINGLLDEFTIAEAPRA